MLIIKEIIELLLPHFWAVFVILAFYRLIVLLYTANNTTRAVVLFISTSVMFTLAAGLVIAVIPFIYEVFRL